MKIFHVIFSWGCKNGRQNVAIEDLITKKGSGDRGECQLLVLCNIRVVWYIVGETL
jgi:hypothetical protein